MLQLIFEIEPVAKARPRVTRYGTYTPQKSVVFEKALAHMARQQYKGAPREGPLGIFVKFVIRKPKSAKRHSPTVKPDLDNYLKSVKDALNGIVWKDDAQIVSCAMVKRYNHPGEGPAIYLVVNEYDST